MSKRFLGLILCSALVAACGDDGDDPTADAADANTGGGDTAADGGGTDAAGTDAGAADAGGADTGDMDAGNTDAGGTDGGGADAGGTDAGGTDTGGTDAGGTDAGGTDAGGTDAGGTDAGGTDAGSTDAGGTDAGGTDAGGTDAGGESYVPTLSYRFMLESPGTGDFVDERHTYEDGAVELSCEIDELGLRLLATAPTPTCNAQLDELPLFLPGTFDPNGRYEYGVRFPGLWAGFAVPKIKFLNGFDGCLVRPLFEQMLTVLFATDEAGITTASVRVDGRTSTGGSSDAEVLLEMTLTFDAAACTGYDSGTPACSGTTLCEAAPPGEICTGTPGCSIAQACFAPTDEECGEFDETGCGAQSRCAWTTPVIDPDSGEVFVPGGCVAEAPPVLIGERCESRPNVDSCTSDGCRWRDVCTGGEVSCTVVPVDDDLLCATAVPGCSY